MDIGLIIAENLKRLRTERNLSLGQLSELCDISKMMLSQIEKGDTNPTINTLWKIANGLKVPYTALLERQEHHTVVVTRQDVTAQIEQDGHYRIYCYYPNTPHRNFEMFQMEMDEGCSYTSIGHSEKSQEYVMVLEGEMTLTVDANAYTLHADDSLSFDASLTHVYANSGQGTMKAVITNYYPV